MSPRLRPPIPTELSCNLQMPLVTAWQCCRAAPELNLRPEGVDCLERWRKSSGFERNQDQGDMKEHGDTSEEGRRKGERSNGQGENGENGENGKMAVWMEMEERWRKKILGHTILLFAYVGLKRRGIFITLELVVLGWMSKGI